MSPLRCVLIAAGLLSSVGAAIGVAAPAGAHPDPCHTRHACPSDHHTYAWRGRLCTSYASERLAEDSITVSVGGRTYWCHATSAGAPEAPGSGGVACGVERWSVKTLTDAGARAVNFTSRPSTIAALGMLRAPRGPGSGRIGPVETTVFRVSARLVAVKAEMDSDLHLVIADPRTRATMIAEFPASFCVGRAAPPGPRAQMRAARAALLRCGPVSPEHFAPLSGVVTITGVGFWDIAHGQRGVAPNAIELHPVLSISGACT